MGKKTGTGKKKSPQIQPHLPPKISDEEFAQLSAEGNFDQLTQDNVYVTDPESYNGYNCVGLVLDDTTYETDIGTVLEMMDLFKSKGYSVVTALSADADIDLWGANVDDKAHTSHVSRKYRGPRSENMPAGLWESKLYPDIAITHGREEIACKAYGKVILSFRKVTVGQ